MNTPVASILVSFAAPMLVLMLALGHIARKSGLKPAGVGWCVGSGLVALGLLMIPVANLPMARAFAGIVDHWSVPTLAFLAAAVTRLFFGTEFLRPQDWRALWIFGIAAGLVLYPMSLGLGGVDPYSYGWRFGPVVLAIGILAFVLQWTGNRAGIILALSLVGWWLGLAESQNIWDCVLDPVFCIGALVWCGAAVGRARSDAP